MCTNLKKELRKTMAAKLSKLTNMEVEEQSDNVFRKVLSSTWYKQSNRISVYVSTDGEIKTDKIILQAINDGKKVFIPQFQKGSKVMEMVHVETSKQFDELPSTLWGIRQPKPEWNWKKYQDFGELDLVLLPGVAFSSKLERCGHGMGYYDRFLSTHQANYGKYPLKVALALEQQMVEHVPTSETDVKMDLIINANRVYE